jgi:hypothetical protein
MRLTQPKPAPPVFRYGLSKIFRGEAGREEPCFMRRNLYFKLAIFYFSNIPTEKYRLHIAMNVG